MDWAHLVLFNATLLAAMASPGPALLFALRQSVGGGLRAGIAAGVGLGLMAASWTALALLGLAAVFAVVPWLYLALKIAGAAYLFWVAWAIWRDAKRPLAAHAQSHSRAFWGGVLINLANPKSVLFAASVLVVIFPPDLSLTRKAFIVANHLAVEIIVYSAFAALLSSPPARAGYLRLKPLFDRIAAGLLAALGLRLLWSR